MILTEGVIRATARDFSKAHLAPHAAEWERTATFPRQARRKMGKLDIQRLVLSRSFEG